MIGFIALFMYTSTLGNVFNKRYPSSFKDMMSILLANINHRLIARCGTKQTKNMITTTTINRIICLLSCSIFFAYRSADWLINIRRCANVLKIFKVKYNITKNITQKNTVNIEMKYNKCQVCVIGIRQTLIGVPSRKCESLKIATKNKGMLANIETDQIKMNAETIFLLLSSLYCSG